MSKFRLAIFISLSICISIFTALVLFEWLQGRGVPVNLAYLLSTTSDPFRRDSDVLLLSPEADFRLTAKLYSADSRQEVFIYENTFKANEYGCVEPDSSSSRPRYIFFGDSFLMGQGSGPLFSQLSENSIIKRDGYLNCGLFSTGFVDWASYVTSNVFGSAGASDSIYVFAFISDDFYRLGFNGKSVNSDCIVFGNCSGGESFLGFRFYESFSGSSEFWDHRRRSTKFSIRRFFFHTFPHSYTTLRRSALTYGRSLAAVNEIVSRFGRSNVAFVWIPEFHEIIGGRTDRTEFQMFRKILSDRGIPLLDILLENESLVAEDYWPYDNHLKPQGSKKVAILIDKFLEANVEH